MLSRSFFPNLYLALLEIGYSTDGAYAKTKLIKIPSSMTLRLRKNIFGSSQSNHGDSNIADISGALSTMRLSTHMNSQYEEGARDVNNIWAPEIICWLSIPRKVAGITQMSSNNCINGFKIAKGKLNFSLLPVKWKCGKFYL